MFTKGRAFLTAQYLRVTSDCPIYSEPPKHTAISQVHGPYRRDRGTMQQTALSGCAAFYEIVLGPRGVRIGRTELLIRHRISVPSRLGRKV